MASIGETGGITGKSIGTLCWNRLWLLQQKNLMSTGSRSGSPIRTRCISPSWAPTERNAHWSSTTWRWLVGRCSTALRDRPTHLQRFPEGIDGEEIYQKRIPQHHPDYLETCRITFPSGRTADALKVTHPASIVWAAQMGTVTLHPWQVRCPDTEHPDELRIDLDPQPGTGFRRGAVGRC